MMKRLLLAAAATLAISSVANAAQIISFGQVNPNNTVTATVNASNTQTTISTTNTAVLITQLFGAVTPPAIPAFFTFSAISIDAAVPVGSALLQHYNGSFCISSGLNCGGAIDLSGTFTDAAFGLNGGPQLSINVANPPDALTLSSSVINLSNLVAPDSFTLSMSNLTPLLHLQGATIAPFTASFSGVASASATGVPEPMSLAVLGMGLLGLGMVRNNKKVM